MTELPSRVQINEEGPREGFQIESSDIATERKLELIDALARTGLRQIQVVSLVNPKKVPGMADADEVVRRIERRPGVRYTALWFNDRGLERALELDKLDIKGSLPMCASDVFLKRNQNRTQEENVEALRKTIQTYKSHGIAVTRGSVMAAFGCNFEGVIPIEKVVSLVGQIHDLAEEYELDINELALADTMAWATPESVKRVVGAVREKFPGFRINLHLHDTRGMGIANAYAGLQMGIDSFDASVAGLGGCPFARHRGAAGNVCTEDLAFMCEEMGIETGIDVEALLSAAHLAEEIVGHQLPGSVKLGGTLSAFRRHAA